jgi:hypothetical protein
MISNPTEDEVAALCFIVSDQKAQIGREKRALEQRRQEANASSQCRRNLTSLYFSAAMQKSGSRSISKDDRHRLSRNLKVDTIDVDILPKTRDSAIMATAAYITANAPNDNEHVAKLHAYVLEGVWVLQTGGVDERRATQHQDHTPVRHSSTEASRQRPLLPPICWGSKQKTNKFLYTHSS